MYDTAYNLDLSYRFKAPNIVFCKVSGALVHVPEKLGSSINSATNDFWAGTFLSVWLLIC